MLLHPPYTGKAYQFETLWRLNLSNTHDSEGNLVRRKQFIGGIAVRQVRLLQSEIAVAVSPEIPGSLQLCRIEPAGVKILHLEDRALQGNTGGVDLLHGEGRAVHFCVFGGELGFVRVILDRINALWVIGTQRIRRTVAPIGPGGLAHLSGFGSALPNEHKHFCIVARRKQIAGRRFDLGYHNAAERHHNSTVQLEQRVGRVARGKEVFRQPYRSG